MRSPAPLVLAASLAVAAVGWWMLRAAPAPVSPGEGAATKAAGGGNDRVDHRAAGAGTEPRGVDGRDGVGGAALDADGTPVATGPEFGDGPRRDPGRREAIEGGLDPREGRDGRADPDTVPDREPGPLPEKGVGLDDGAVWNAADAQRVEDRLVLVNETIVPRIRWKNRSLRAAAEEIERLGGGPVELASEDLLDEPVTLEGDDLTVKDLLLRIAETRHLRVQIRPDRIVLKRQ